MINRAAIIIRYREPAIDWLNRVDPYDDGREITWEEANHDATVYLVSPEDTESWDAIEEWVRINFAELFEAELEEWYADPMVWPQERSLALFWEWFDVEVHTALVDTVGTPIEEEDELLPPYHLDS